MRIGLFFFIICSLSLSGCWRDGSNQDFFIASEPITCTVAFDFLSISLPDATEGVAYADTTSLFSVTSGGIPPYFYSGTFSATANLVVESDGDVVSGVGGAGVVGTYTATVVVVDSTGVCTDSITVSVTIDPSTPVEICSNGLDDDGDTFTDCADTDCVADPFCVVTPPRIDPAGTISHANGGGGGTDLVSGSALSNSDAVPDFIGVQSNANGSAADRVFVIDIDSDGVGLDPLTVNDTNVTIFEISSGTLLPSAVFDATYDAIGDTITVTIPGGLTGFALAEGGTYVITISATVTNTLGDPFTIAPTATNSIRFLTVPDWTTLVFDGLSASGAACITCHTGVGSVSSPATGGIAVTYGVGATIDLEFDTTAVLAYTSLLRPDAGDATRTYISLNNGVAGFATNNPNSAILVNKLSALSVLPSFGSKMPLLPPGTGALDDATVETLTGGPDDPDTAVLDTITDARFMLELRSWIRGGAPDIAE